MKEKDAVSETALKCINCRDWSEVNRNENQWEMEMTVCAFQVAFRRQTYASADIFNCIPCQRKREIKRLALCELHYTLQRCVDNALFKLHIYHLLNLFQYAFFIVTSTTRKINLLLWYYYSDISLKRTWRKQKRNLIMCNKSQLLGCNRLVKLN
jgi:hypothetical protein